MERAKKREVRKLKTKELVTAGNLKPLAISLGLMFFQQLSGINAVMFYSVSIFRLAGSTIDSNLATIVLGVVNICATIFSNALIDRLGRKVLLYMSSVGMIISLSIFGGYFYMKVCLNTILMVLEYIVSCVLSFLFRMWTR